MTIVLRETTCVDQTLTYAPPTFQARAILAYGHDSTIHGKSTGGSGSGGWGFQTETGGGLWGAVSYDISAIGSLENGSSGFSAPGTTFYSAIGNTTATGVLRGPTFNCGSATMAADLDTSTYVGLFVIGGMTVQAAIGYGQFSGTGSLAITGVGFEPDLVLMSGAGHAFTGGGGPSLNMPVNGSFGAADSSGNQFAVAVGNTYLLNTSNRVGQTVNDACFLQLKPGVMKANLTSMDSDGFTLNCSTFSGSEYFWWVAISDPNGNFKVGTLTEGDASISPGFTPEALMFASAGNNTYGTSQGGCGLAYGGASSDSSAEYSGWLGAVNGNFISARYWTTKALSWIIHPTGAGVVSEAEASISSWGSTTNLSWTTGPGANGIVGGYVAMKTSEGAGFAGCGATFVPQIYRWIHGSN